MEFLSIDNTSEKTIRNTLLKEYIFSFRTPKQRHNLLYSYLFYPINIKIDDLAYDVANALAWAFLSLGANVVATNTIPVTENVFQGRLILSNDITVNTLTTKNDFGRTEIVVLQFCSNLKITPTIRIELDDFNKCKDKTDFRDSYAKKFVEEILKITKGTNG